MVLQTFQIAGPESSESHRTSKPTLQAALRIPAYGLVDCGPYGLSLLLTYINGSARGGVDGRAYTADVKVLSSSLVYCASTRQRDEQLLVTSLRRDSGEAKDSGS